VATFREFLKVAEVTFKDKTSGKRMREIMAVLKKFHVTHGLTPQKACELLEALGPTYVKVGQLASTRSDILPKEYCEAFEQLQTKVTPMPFETVLNVIDEAYTQDGSGRKWQDVFLAIDPVCVGSASVAQVHRAVLLDGTVVALKVRRPGIVKQMAEDIALMKRLLTTAEFLSTEHQTILLNFSSLLEELERTTENELDFSIERKNLERFYRELKQEIRQPDITCPIPFPDISNDSLLVMQYVQGVAGDDVEALKASGVDADKLARRLVDNYVTQVLDCGFFHADPHGGNIFVNGNEIIWIDLGMTGSLTLSERQLVGRMFRSVVINDAYELLQSVVGLSKRHGDISYTDLLSALSGLLGKYSTAELKDINVGVVFEEVIEVLRAQNLILVPAVTMLVRGLATIEGVLEKISPDTNVVKIVGQHVMAQSLDAQHLKLKATELLTASEGSLEALVRLPAQMSSTMDMLNQGQMSVKMDMSLRTEVLSALYTSIGRFSLALISAGLFLGSSILCTTNMEPKILEVPVLGVLGYIGALILGVYVIFLTFRTRHRFKNHLDPD
jgi:ubiquinone biosynthesis protein